MYKIVIDSEEATLEIERVNNRLKMGQLLGPNNKPVSNKLRYAVDDWFRQYLFYLSLGD
jgi:hypothetical protein